MLSRFVLLFCGFVFLGAAPVFAQVSTVRLLGEFEEGWEKIWLERKLTHKGTTYEIATEDTNRMLMASCENEASGLWRMLDIRAGKRGKISWRWKVRKMFSGKPSEKTKMGDDFVARVYVVFEPHFVSWKTYALCYVWAAKLPEGTTFRSPYAKTVGTIVVQSGGKNKGKWVRESRNYVADFKNVFGHEPEMVTAVAIMVDSDNTGQKAETYFDDLELTYGTRENGNKPPSIMMGN